jgi:hypothetical protein
LAEYPSILVLIVCKVVLLGDVDPHTGWQNTEWDTEHGTMHCRRMQVDLYDRAVDQGAAPQPFNPTACMRAAMTMGPQYDVDQTTAKRPWRFWRAACPTPIYPDADADGKPDRGKPPVAWKIPECPASKGVLECEGDTTI